MTVRGDKPLVSSRAKDVKLHGESARQRILEAAGPIFARKGFQSATVREICKAAGVNVAAVNYYFGDKEHLYIEAVKLARQQRVAQAPLPQWPAGTPVEVKLRDFVRTMLIRMVSWQRAPWQVQLMMREVLQPTSACAEMVREYFQPHLRMLLDVLGEAMPSDVPEHRRYQIAFSVIGQCVFYRVASEVVTLVVGEERLREQYTIDHLADHISRFTLAALGVLPPIVERETSADLRTKGSS